MPRSKEDFEKIRLATRKKILAVALKQFANDGFAHTSIQSIADKVGIAKSSVYHHFKSKDEILITLLDDYYHNWSKEVDFTQEFEDPKKHLFDVIHKTVSYITSNRDFFLMMDDLIRVVIKKPHIMESAQKMGIEKATIFASVFEKLGVQNVENEMLLFNSSFSGATRAYLLMGNEYPFEKVVDLMLQRYK